MRTLILFSLCSAMFAQAPAQPAKPALKLTETESLKLELIKAHKQVAEMACAPMANNVRTEFSKWKEETLAAHGNPKDILFDENSWQFVDAPKLTAEQLKAKEARDARAAQLHQAVMKEVEDMRAQQTAKADKK